jgi:hypothetical protein
MPKQIELQADWSALAEVIGTVKGATKVLDDSRFMDLLITRAHTEAAIQFDGDAAAYAAATGTLGHMYEWGTAGINTGRTTRRMDPLSSDAKLWRHTLAGNGRTKEAGFNFQPSVVPIPAPTVKATGVPRAQLALLKGGPYVFAAKASIMESGTTVTIRPRGDNMLFLPFGPDGPRSSKYAGLTHIWTRGPIRSQPGKTYAGNFSKFWLAWWASEGEKIMSESIETAVDVKMRNLLDSAGRRMGTRPTKMSTAQFKIDMSKAQVTAERKMYAEMERP